MVGLDLGDNGGHDVAVDFRNLPLAGLRRGCFFRFQEPAPITVEEGVVRRIGAAQRISRSVFGEQIDVQFDVDRISVEPEICDLRSGRDNGRLAAIHGMC